MPMQADYNDDVALSFESPESSNIAGASYDPDTLTLTIQFKGHRGQPERSYAHSGSFTMAQWEEFSAAPSKGQFFAEQIKPLFELRRIS